MPIKVKVCGITTVADATMALEEGVDYIGINLWPRSPRGVDLMQAREVLRVVPRGRRVLVDVCPDLSLLKAYMQDFDFFQLHFPVEDWERYVPSWQRLLERGHLWLAPRRQVENESLPEPLLALSDTFLVDAHRAGAYGGTGKTASWADFAAQKKANADKTWVLAGGLSPDNIEEAIQKSGTEFVDINSGIETAPGLKNREALKRLMLSVKKMDAS